MKHFELIDLKVNGDERGRLISIEKNNNCPFDVKRVFYIFDTKTDVARGCHANKYSEFVLIPINGSCKVKIDDGKGNISNVVLNNPHQGLYLKNMVWKEMYDFSYNAILMVVTNTVYDSSEYIRDYNEFKKALTSNSCETTVSPISRGG